MRDERLTKEGEIVEPDHNGGIYTAIDAWGRDPTAAKVRYGPIASWDTSGVTSMDYLFMNNIESFNEDISCWNVSNVVNMDAMFWSADSFNGDLSRWNVGQVRSMRSMFQRASSFNGDLSHWDVGQVKNMENMFDGATSFDSDLSSWDVAQVQNMRAMFSSASSFNGDLSNWDVGQVMCMNHMFWHAQLFAHQLKGAWSTSTAQKYKMFGNSPGTIAGKMNDANGTPEMEEEDEEDGETFLAAHYSSWWNHLPTL